MIKVIEISLPEYTIKKKPDYVKIGKKVDSTIGKAFPDGKYILRAIGADDHPNLTLEELIDIIIKTGTDRYDPKKKAVAHEEFSGYDYDIHAGIIEIKNSKVVITKNDEYPTMFGSFVYNFYENAPLDRGHAVRIDLLLLYDPKKMQKAKKINQKALVKKGLDKFLYRFKGDKKEALLGIVKIMRK
jgi:hypothetical protein